MTCGHCQREISDESLFCQFCGADQRPAPPAHEATREPLRRSLVERQVAGVCGGIAHYLGTDPVLVRLAWIILTIVPGSIFLGVLAYIVAWLIVPEADPGAESGCHGPRPIAARMVGD